MYTSTVHSRELLPRCSGLHPRAAQVGPFGFAYGSRDDVLLKTAASLRESSNSAMICGGLGICSMAFGTIALLSASS